MPTHDRLALDRAMLSVRSKDVDGRLRVEVSPISKATVNGYYGREIPGSEALGLRPDRIYRLYRCPDELAAAAATFNHVPLLDRHIPVSAAAPQKEAVVGSTGTTAFFEPPYLKNSLVVWAQDAIDLIESGEQKEISSAYRYRADMTPGTSPDGDPFDGIMRDLVANHVAIVAKGRAGPDVVVGDEAPNPTLETEKRQMAIKKILSPSEVKAKTALAKSLRARLAQDADLDVLDVLSVLDGITADPDVTEVSMEVVADDTDLTVKVRAILGPDVSDEDVARIVELLQPMKADEVVETVVVDEPKDDEPKDEDDDKVTKVAMDAAIAAAVRTAEANTVKRLKDARDAERTVEPWVGKLVAMDSAEDVYRAALKTLGVDVKGVHASALSHVLRAQPLPGARANSPRIAADSASTDDFSKRFPTARAIRHI